MGPYFNMTVVLIERRYLDSYKGTNTCYLKEQGNLFSFSWTNGKTKEDTYLFFTKNSYFLKRGFNLLKRSTLIVYSFSQARSKWMSSLISNPSLFALITCMNLQLNKLWPRIHVLFWIISNLKPGSFCREKPLS